jgi:hypothetical protein
MTSLITKRAARLLVGALAGVWLVGAGAALAVEGNPPPAAIDDQPITVFTGDPAAMAQGGEADRLVQYVRAQGAARVIVGLLELCLRKEIVLAQLSHEIGSRSSVDPCHLNVS